MQTSPIIDPIDKSLIMSELTPEKFLRKTRKGGNEIYVVTHHNAPNTVREIGRLREEAFRAAGGGTGLDCDLDLLDTMENPYMQLLVWNPDSQEILGGYRFLLGDRVQYDSCGVPLLATSHMFHFSDKFKKEYMPYTLELGRSFVTLAYQSTRAGAKGLFALDNLWDGLGALTIVYPYLKYFFGKVTMYPSYPSACRDMILFFLRKHFEDKDCLVTPISPLQTEMDHMVLDEMFQSKFFSENYKILNTEIRKHGINIPPLVNAYMGLSPTMRVFGTAVNDEFGDVEETGIMITIDEMLEEKRNRHIESYDRGDSFRII